MSQATDIRAIGAAVYFIPVTTRVPLKFGKETTTSVTCARARVRVRSADGRTAEGWGETPLSVQWVWPSSSSYERRHEQLKMFCARLTESWSKFEAAGHPLELGHDFQEQVLIKLWHHSNQQPDSKPERMPWLAALVCCSAFDLALHDAFGQLHQRPAYTTYGPEFMNRDLGDFLEPAPQTGISFKGKYPDSFFARKRPQRLRAWHLVGGLDLLDRPELSGNEPQDGYPVLLEDWIEADGLKCLKVKLRGDDAGWDFERLARVGTIALERRVDWLSADFNCTVNDPEYVNGILDALLWKHPRIYGMILYVEQPFPYELEQHQIDVHSVSARKPLFMDESAHDWKLIELGRRLGWTGVALKTCKTQTGALLSLCWAKAHGMTLMVQDLTNPMLAQIPHLLLAAYAGTMMGVETNSMQFYPEASMLEAAVHPGLYRRREGKVDLSSICGPGFGYRLNEIKRALPEPAAVCGDFAEI